MMTARHGDDSIVAPALPYDDVERVRRIGHERDLLCPGCEEPVHLKTPNRIAWHFAHYPTGRSCFLKDDADYKNETPEHIWSKAALARWLERYLGADGSLFGQTSVVVEGRIPETGQVADVLCTTTEGHRIAFEVQVSRLSVSDWQKRAGLYASAGVTDLWLLCGPRWTRRRSRLGSLEAAILRERGRVFFFKAPDALPRPGGRDGRASWRRGLEGKESRYRVGCLDGIARVYYDAPGDPERERQHLLQLPMTDRTPYLHSEAWVNAPSRYARDPFDRAGTFWGSLRTALISPVDGPSPGTVDDQIRFYVSKRHEAESSRAMAWDRASAAWTAAYGQEIHRAQLEAVGRLVPGPSTTPSREIGWSGGTLPTFHRMRLANREAERVRQEKEEAHATRSRELIARSLRKMEEEQHEAKSTAPVHTLQRETYTCTLCGTQTTSPIVVIEGGKVVKCRACIGRMPER